MPEQWVMTTTGLKRLAEASQLGTALKRSQAISSKSPDQQNGRPAEQDEASAQAALQALRREVNLLGAQHLDKKADKQSFQSQAMQELGFAPIKRPRTGASSHSVMQPGFVIARDGTLYAGLT